MTKQTQKHTPGPWEIDEMWALIKHGNKEICAIHTGNKYDQTLLASAPDLLEACEDLVSRAYKLKGSDTSIELRQMIKAIAKAKGERSNDNE